MISITDGQIYLEGDLFLLGRPSRHQRRYFCVAGGRQRPDQGDEERGRNAAPQPCTQFRELEAFAGFGSDLDAASQAQLARGRRVVEVLKQRQYAPVPVAGQVL